ncbi:MAG: hypothetical protein H7Y27_06380 [Gemmatimonadaceae bacterium]|nr:hypothetical protein [Chitinophagaceae bacterium]
MQRWCIAYPCSFLSAMPVTPKAGCSLWAICCSCFQ